VIVFQRGETLSLALDVVTGDPALVTAVSAVIRRSTNGAVSGPATPLVTSFAAASGAEPARWLVTLIDTSALAPGKWLVDARLTIGTGTIITDPCPVTIVEAPSSPLSAQ